MNFMNYRDFFKNKKATAKDIQNLIPEGVDPKEFNKGIKTEKEHTDDEFMAAKIAGDHLKEDPHYYSKLSSAGLEEDIANGDIDGYEDNGGLPKVGGALAIPHHGQPIMMGKIIQVGGEFKGGKSASGELSGMSNCGSKGVAKDTGGLPVQNNSKEPITAGGKSVDSSIASKSVGGAVVPGEGQKQGGLNSQGTIASTPKLNESKETIRKMVKEVLKEIRFDKESGKWVRIDEKVDMKMGASYKVVQPTLAQTVDQDKARTNQYEPEITEMYDDEEEMKLNERYVELANAQRNLNETELAELTSIREKIDQMQVARRNDGLSRGGVDPNIYENEKWIQKAINPKHKGYCTPMTKSTCTPHRKAFAMRAKHHDLEEDVNMKMGPSYKTVQPTLAKTSDDDFARQNQYDPQISECDCEDPNHAHNQMDEAGGGAVQHSSYRTINHGNLPQDPEQRWADDLDEGESKTSKKIAKGQKGKSSMFSQNLKHQKPKKTTSGVHKRKS